MQLPDSTEYRGVDHRWTFNLEECSKKLVEEAVSKGNHDLAIRHAARAQEYGHMANCAYDRIYPYPDEETENYEDLLADILKLRAVGICKELGIDYDPIKDDYPDEILGQWYYRYIIPTDAGKFKCPNPYPINAQFD